MCGCVCMETSNDNYYTDMCNIINYYNDHNNTPLSNKKIREEIRKVMEEESITDATNITAYTFSHASNAQRENTNAIFTSKKMD